MDISNILRIGKISHIQYVESIGHTDDCNAPLNARLINKLIAPNIIQVSARLIQEIAISVITSLDERIILTRKSDQFVRGRWVLRSHGAHHRKHNANECGDHPGEKRGLTAKRRFCM